MPLEGTSVEADARKVLSSWDSDGRIKHLHVKTPFDTLMPNISVYGFAARHARRAAPAIIEIWKWLCDKFTSRNEMLCRALSLRTLSDVVVAVTRFP